MLKQGLGDRAKLDWITDWDQGRLAMAENIHSLYLVDFNLGANDGLELVRTAVEQGCSAPIILLTGNESGDIDIEAVRAGASDYLVKDQMSSALLTKAIHYALGRQQFNRSLIEAKELLAQKNKKLSQLYKTAHQFVDNVSHEFRTPLAVIKEYSAIICEGLAGPVNEEQARFLSVVLNRVDDLGLMVNDMLDTSRLEAGLLRTRRTVHQLEDIIDRVEPVLRRKAETSGVVYLREIAAELPEVYCDAEKIGRAIINLAVNAIKFSGESGQVVLWARLSPVTSEVTIGVSDNGPGIAADRLTAIFERFNQVGLDAHATSQGFGLGLNIANELINLNLGKISVESEVGKGSIFSFGIPIFNPLEVINKWRGYIECLPDRASNISLFSITCAATADADMLQQTHEVLLDAVFSDDLLLRTRPDGWTLLAASSQQEMDLIICRIEQAHEEFNLHVLMNNLPGVRCRLIGTWPLQSHNQFLHPDVGEHVVSEYDNEPVNDAVTSVARAVV